ncbi:MAG: hypothetical protein FJ100_18665 [Deltaproteobacteria bacterium]|nr:hypothetical protein [Deltaproteobacteria bacterium]
MLLMSRLGRVGAYLDRLSDRERKIVFGGGALLVLAAVLSVSVLVSRKVSGLQEEVATNEVALADIAAAGPRYLRLREEEKAVQEQLDRASKEPLQATVLGIAKEIKYDKKMPETEGATSSEKLADVIKFSNASEVLAELTTKHKKGAPKKKPKKKGGKEVFLSTIDAVFQNVPDEALLLFMSKLETHPEPMFGLSVDIQRTGSTRDQMQATIKIGQFRYGVLED